MKRKVNHNCRVLAVILVFAFVFTFANTINAAALTEGKHSYTCETSWYSEKFKVDGGYTGTCAEAGPAAAKSGTATVKKLSTKTDAAKAIYYFAIKKNWENELGYKNSSQGFYLKCIVNHFYSPHKHADRESYANRMLNSYNWKSVEVPAGFELYHCSAGNSRQDFVIWKYTPVCNIDLVKESSKTSVITNGTHSLAGIEYTVYSKKSGDSLSGKVGVLTVKADGTTNTIKNVPVGTYWAKETKTNDYFKLDSTIKSVKATKDGQTVTFSFKNDPYVINLTLKKSVPDKNALAKGLCSVEGIEYTVYSKKSGDSLSGKVGVLTVKKDGTTNTLKNLPPGKYYAKETKVPADTGLVKSNNILTIDATAKSTTAKTYTFKAIDEQKPAYAYVEKYLEDGSEVTESFKFIINDANTGAMVKKLTTKAGNPGTSDKVALTPGTYKVMEELPADSQFEPVTAPITFTVKAGETYRIKWTNRKREKEELLIQKVALDGSSPENFKFNVKGYPLKDEDITPLDAATVLDKANISVTGYDSDYTFDDTAWNVNADDLAAANAAAQKGEAGDFDVKITNTLKAKDVTMPETTDLADVQTKFSNGTIPEGTIITDGSDCYRAITDVNFDPADLSTLDLTDTALFEAYTLPTKKDDVPLTATLKIAVKKSVLGDDNAGTFTTDGDNDSLTPEAGITLTYSRSFTFFGKENPLEFSLTTDDTGLAKKNEIPAGRYVVTEQMTDAQKQVFHYEDGQTFTYGGQSYKVQLSQEKIITKDSDLDGYKFPFVNIPYSTPVKLQKVSTGEVSGLTFHLSGTTTAGRNVDLTFVTDGKGLIDFGELAPGNYVLEETDFDARSWFNCYKLAGHDNPAIAFSLTGKEDGTVWIGGDIGEGSAKTGKPDEPAAVWHNEEFAYLLISKLDGRTKNFLPGAEFELTDSAGLVARFEIIKDANDEASANMLDAREGITAGKVADFDIPDQLDYDYIVISGLEQGKEYTLKETKAPEGYVPHEDIKLTTEERVTKVEVDNFKPTIGTTALDSKTDDHISKAGKKTVIKDTVAYRHLQPGKTYVLTGTLVYAGEKFKSLEKSTVLVDGKPVTKTISFVPEKSDGTVELKFTVDTTLLAGKTVVAFEKVEDEGVEVAIHFDPFDEDQTVYIPKIGTVASLEEKNVIDIVEYRNLLKGRTYTFKGWLVDKETGKRIKDSEGSTILKLDPALDGEPEAAIGTVNVTLPFSRYEQQGKSLVVFEEVYLVKDDGTEIKVGEHKDETDKRQTVKIPGIGTTLTDAETGTHIAYAKKSIRENCSHYCAKAGSTSCFLCSHFFQKCRTKHSVLPYRKMRFSALYGKVPYSFF